MGAVPLAMFIGRTMGDPAALKEAYDKEMTALAGLPGRGEDWGVPLVALVHICAFSDDAMYEVNLFRDEETMRSLIFEPEKLPLHLRPAPADGASMWSTLGIPSYRERWDTPDVSVYRVGKVLPPLHTVISDEGGLLRQRF
jgi:hypothetical protein